MHLLTPRLFHLVCRKRRRRAGACNTSTRFFLLTAAKVLLDDDTSHAFPKQEASAMISAVLVAFDAAEGMRVFYTAIKNGRSRRGCTTTVIQQL